MAPQQSPTEATTTSHDGFALQVSLRVLSLSSVYASSLAYLERRFPIKPDHIWAEVAGGVLISLLPVAMQARRTPQVDWKTYEGAIWGGFIAAGVPIILWQLGEALLRQQELLRYTTSRLKQVEAPHAYHTASVADRGGKRARNVDPDDAGSDWGAAAGPDYA